MRGIVNRKEVIDTVAKIKKTKSEIQNISGKALSNRVVMLNDCLN